ncbi:MAG: selenocysteine-specific translation elongation factor [Acidimicrobiales bacterium]|nr:selenocysteine-specific translation elongation factor [Acidimicrobiales bacterium]
MSTTHVVSTAGHVDHGKSTLVRSLTGTDPDRWAEEKERGLTIDLGFASLVLPSGAVAALVDVPGHERFIRNMLAGVGAVDACIFVVAATEGWKPQSEEHLRILELLGVRHGVVALTKVGLVDDELLELAHLDVEEHTVGTFLEGADVIPVDAIEQRGVDHLAAALDRLLAITPTATDRGRPRLWVDRSFTARGAGTVVTGTLTGGPLRVDEDVALLPAQRSARVRGIQSLHHQRDSVGPGTRVALNLSGVAHNEVRRGDAVVKPGHWHLTRMVDASLSVLSSLDHEVSRRGAYLAYLGSGEHPVKVRILGPSALQPGEQGAVRLYLPDRLPLLPGDRFVLRESGRAETIGGGEVLDVDPRTPAARARPDRSVERVVRERGWVDVDELERLTGERHAATLGRWVVAPEALDATREHLLATVAGAGPMGVDLAALDERQRAVLATVDELEVDGAHVRQAEQVDPLLDHPYLAALESEPFTPPDPEPTQRAEVREMVRRGLVVEADGVFFAAAAIDAAAREVARLLAGQPDGVTVAEVREHLGTTRKYALPLLGHLDATGVTRRRGDVRIGGPRLPTPDDRP